MAYLEIAAAVHCAFCASFLTTPSWYESFLFRAPMLCFGFALMADGLSRAGWI